MNNERQVIHIRIRDLRRERELTQEELAEALGISRQSINAMEAGRCMPSLPVAMQIASYFAVPLTRVFAPFLDGEDPENHLSNPNSNSLTERSQEINMAHLVPWSPLREMREILDGFMDESMNLNAVSVTLPAVNVAQTSTEVHIDLRLPGFKKEDLSIEVGEEFVSISGESKQEEEKEDKQYYRREFAAQSFSRTIPLPTPVQTENAVAEMKHGVLQIKLQKVKEEKPKTQKIEIQS